jgi:transcriptional regulator with XRE-family HTH domain
VRLKNARLALGLTHQDVGARIGITATGYGNYERGTRLPPVDQLVRLTGALECSINYLLDLPAGKNGLTAEEEELVLAFRAVRVPMIRESLLRMVRAAAPPPE